MDLLLSGGVAIDLGIAAPGILPPAALVHPRTSLTRGLVSALRDRQGWRKCGFCRSKNPRYPESKISHFLM